MPSPSVGRHRVGAIDVLRGLTILWVTALHFYVDTRGVPEPAVASAAAWWDALKVGDPLGAARVVWHSLIGLPGFRLDLLLFVTAVAAGLGRPVATASYYRRRARAILPAYWTGSVLVLVVAATCAWVRAASSGAPWFDELHHGSRLAGLPYVIEPGDLLRSLSIVGRFQDARTMQVVAPSLWYVVLVAQVIIVLPWLRRLHEAIGSAWLVAGALGLTTAARAAAFAAPPLSSFDANALVICFLPFRLIGPVLGLVAARLLMRPRGTTPRLRPSRRLMRAAAVMGAVALVVTATWAGTLMNVPGTLSGVLGPVVPLSMALPGLWWVASRCRQESPGGRLLRWAGQHSLSILVVQDALRLMVGTYRTLAADGPGLPLLALPVYLAIALGLARLWHPWPLRIVSRLGWTDAAPTATRQPPGAEIGVAAGAARWSER